MKRILLPLLFVTSMLVGCSHQEPVLPEGIIVVSIDFSKAEKTNTSSPNFNEKFIPNFAYKGTNLVSSLTHSGYCQINENNQTVGANTWKETVLSMGNSSGKGELNFTFTNTLKSIKFTARAHTKLYKSGDTQGISADQGSQLLINNQTWSLPTATLNNYELQEQSFEVNSKSLTLKTLDEAAKRVWIFTAELRFEA